MAKVIRSVDLPAWKKKKDDLKARGKKAKVYKDKKWDQLSTQEKDSVLQEVAVRMGLIQNG